MQRSFKLSLSGLAVLLLAACASTPQQRFASSIQAAQAANRPLVIYGFGTDYTRTGNIENFVFDNHEFGAQQGVSVINAASKPIQKLAFKIEYYKKDRPQLDQHGKPIAWTLIGIGPFASGSSHMVVGNVPKPIVQDWLASGCPHLVGIQGKYADGSTFEVDSHDASQYLTPQINVNCVRRPGIWYGGPSFNYSGTSSGAVGRSPGNTGKSGGG